LSTDGAYRASEQALDAYAAQAGHQLGEAVALMRASCSVLEREMLGPEGADGVRALVAGIQRAQLFVDDLLELRAVGAHEPSPRATLLDAVVEEAQDQLEGVLAGITVRRASLPRVLVDRKMALLLFTHLFRVAVASGATEILVFSLVEAGWATVEVADNGKPPARGDPEDLFAPFGRARGRGPVTGAGVSLALARRIVERHGGSISVGRRPDGGTVVTLTLPAIT